MYKHECVQCSKQNGHRCPLNISFFDRFIGSTVIDGCINYQNRINKKR